MTYAIMTVIGPLEPTQVGVVDAHNHVWIEPVEGAAPGAPVLNDIASITAELGDYRRSGGGMIVDCQPGGCGRNGLAMRALSISSNLPIVASTGYHLRKYYPPDHWLFDASSERAYTYFLEELNIALQETRQEQTPVEAGMIKIACEAQLEHCPLGLMEAAAAAGRQSGAAVQAHTEKGADAERIARFLLDAGLPAEQLIMAHMDKRPDLALHTSLAQEGILLEYDTFYRPRYNPEEGAWPLIKSILAAGLEDSLALATDMAETQFWHRMGGKPGLEGMLLQIIPRLRRTEVNELAIRKITGENIAHRLARPL
jgi:predicted metal-dependent phosphotriesterase family hydrolase